MVISSTSAIDFPLKRTSNVSRLYRLPWHTSHGTITSGKKFISMVLYPLPLHFSQRPPFTLNENRPGLYARILASGMPANRLRISEKTPVYVAGLERGVRPIGD